MVFSGNPFYSEAVAKKFPHKPLYSYVIYGVQVLSFEDTQEGLVVCYDGEVCAGQVYPTFLHRPLYGQQFKFYDSLVLFSGAEESRARHNE